MADRARSLPIRPISRARCITKPARESSPAARVKGKIGVYGDNGIVADKDKKAMADVKELRCVIGDCRFAVDEVSYTCPNMASWARSIFCYDYAALRAELDRDALSASPRQLLALQAADAAGARCQGPATVRRLDAAIRRAANRAKLGLRSVCVKDDGANPTGSLKDRASALVLARALEQGIGTVSTASTGNAAAALAGLGASLPEVDIVIFVPASAPAAKIAQLLVYGAEVLLVEGSYDEAFDLCMETCAAQGWYSRNTGVNPFTTEGKENRRFGNRRAVELARARCGRRQRRRWQHHQRHVQRLLAICFALGWIDAMPRLIGVQAEGSAVLAKCLQPGPCGARHSTTRSGIDHRRQHRLRAAARSRQSLAGGSPTGGGFVTVSDAAIQAAIPEFAQLSGVFAEPAAAAAYAGLKALKARESSAARSVCIVSTGNGLKDVARARESVRGRDPGGG